MAQRKRKTAPHGGILAYFSRTCEGCAYVAEEGAGKRQLWHRCSVPGPRKGYMVSHNGRFLPYVPAWCPLMEQKAKQNGGKTEAETYAEYPAYVKDWAKYENEEEIAIFPLTYEELTYEEWKEENAE